MGKRLDELLKKAQALKAAQAAGGAPQQPSGQTQAPVEMKGATLHLEPNSAATTGSYLDDPKRQAKIMERGQQEANRDMKEANDLFGLNSLRGAAEMWSPALRQEILGTQDMSGLDNKINEIRSNKYLRENRHNLQGFKKVNAVYKAMEAMKKVDPEIAKDMNMVFMKALMRVEAPGVGSGRTEEGGWAPHSVGQGKEKIKFSKEQVEEIMK